jgi:hypothetical protein
MLTYRSDLYRTSKYLEGSSRGLIFQRQDLDPIQNHDSSAMASCCKRSSPASAVMIDDRPPFDGSIAERAGAT